MAETIKRIHAEFDSAQERMLEEAKRFIEDFRVGRMRKARTKAERVNKLGFTSSIPAKIGNNIIYRYNQSQEVLKHVEYFSFHYPHNKFITEKEVKRICEKYGLVLGDAHLYTGDIPEKNIQEIERFALRKEDFFHDTSINYDWEFNHPLINTPNAIRLRRSFHKFNFSAKRADEPVKRKPPFKIVASYKDFDTSFTVLKEHKLEFHIPDPIVLQPVKGGYLIVSKWGLEASDESLVNEILN